MSNRSAIVVGIDASWARTGVVEWALQESRFSSGPVHALHVVDEKVPAGSGPVGAEVGSARRLVAEVTDYLQGHGGGIPHTAEVLAGRPERTLVEAADGCRMLVVGRHGRGMLGRLLIGSTAEDVAYQARVPVVVVPEQWVPPVDTAAPILVGVDEDEQSEAAIGFAVELAAERRVPVRLVHVWDVAAIYTWDATPASTTVAEWRDHNEARLEEIARRWRDKYPDVTFRTKLMRGHAVYGLLDAARDAEAQLLVLGGRRHGRLASMLLGSTARAVLQHAPCPMAIVHEVPAVS